MGRAAKRPRTLHEIAQAEDPSDGDYTDHETRPRTRKSSAKASHGKRPASAKRKTARRRARSHYSDADEDDLEISMNEAESEESGDQDYNAPKTRRGTKVRKAARAASYQDLLSNDEEIESASQSGNDVDADGEADGDAEDDVNGHVANGDGQENQDGEDEDSEPIIIKKDRSLILSIPMLDGQINGGARILRNAFTTRRSTRATSVDAGENMIELTSSGRHSRPARHGTQSPQPANIGAKHPVIKPEPIQEEDELDSSQPILVTNGDPPMDLPLHDSAQAPVPPKPENDVQHEPHQAPEPAVPESDVVELQQSPEKQRQDVDMPDVQAEDYVPESQHNGDDDDDEGPISTRRTLRRRQPSNTGSAGAAVTSVSTRRATRSKQTTVRETRLSKRNLRSRTTRQTKGQQTDEEDADFKPDEEEEADEDEDESEEGTQGNKDDNNNDESAEQTPVRRLRPRVRQSESGPEGETEAQELAEELAELGPGRRRRSQLQISYETRTKPRRNAAKKVDYRLFPSELPPIDDEDYEVRRPYASTGGGGGGGTRWKRTLFSTYGPFGGAGGPAPLFGGPPGMEALGGADSDSSEDEFGQRKKLGSSAGLPGLGAEAMPGVAGGVANLGKVKDRQALADNDPLGVDQNVDFDSVGGLQGHIDKLKEMVSLPLLYPEIFQRFHLVPPRGVLFHGPPGTGKTLLARALASSLSSEGKKVTFYMRKGADALSKWVGEAERQLRLLFEDARKNQPSIIFFDEIDGLAPVRSSKQEQIHASIVSTLLALMDGMDGRGQVIVIGATNRPDSVDPALRRPGRFDREFYFPLPNSEGRRAILDIHTKGWQPPVPDQLKDKLAEITKGYGGADLRALCTEAALNAVQRRYPQIYRSTKKLLIDPEKIEVTPRDFMMSVKNLVPSSERSASSGAAPLPSLVEPLLRQHLNALIKTLKDVFPRKKALTALEEAQYEQPEDQSFTRELMQQAFETARVHRPTILIRGPPGHGQHYLGAALLNSLEGTHVQSFDLPTLLGDSTRSAEATIVQLFAEVKKQKPSVIYLPDFTRWGEALGSTAIATFNALLRSVPPSDPILLLGVMEHKSEDHAVISIQKRFGFHKLSEYVLTKPEADARREFFQALVKYICASPNEIPDPETRKKRQLEELPPAPVEEKKQVLTKDELKALKRRDRQTLNLLKIRIQPIMDQIKKNYKRFRTPVVDETQIQYLFDEEDPTIFTSDLPIESRAQFRPFEKDTDKHDVPGLREVASGKFFYNLDIVIIEKRLSNGYYKRPSDFLADIKRIAKDARQCGDYDRQIKGNELLSNVEVDIGTMESSDPMFVAECENVYLRELEREKIAKEKAKQAEEESGLMGPPRTMNVPHGNDAVNRQSPGPIVLGESFTSDPPFVRQGVDTSTPAKASSTRAVNGSHQYMQVSFDNSDTSNIQLHDHGGSTASGFQTDVQMSNTEESNTSSSLAQSAQPKPFHSWTAPSQQMKEQNGIGRQSQTGALTTMVPGSHPSEYANEASTTQTGTDQKDSSNQTDQAQQQQNQHLPHPPQSVMQPLSSSFREAEPNMSLFPASLPGDENMPNTQVGDSATWSSQSYQPDRAPQFLHPSSSWLSSSFSKPSHPSPQTNTSSNPKESSNSGNQSSGGPQQQSTNSGLGWSQPSPPPRKWLDELSASRFHDDLVAKTSDFTVEQLETLNAQLVYLVWQHRAEWNRNVILNKLSDTFPQILRDVSNLASDEEQALETL